MDLNDVKNVNIDLELNVVIDPYYLLKVQSIPFRIGEFDIAPV